MEFKTTRDIFLEGLAKVQGVVERKNTMPVLSNVLLEADSKGLKITATDLEVSLVSFIQAQVAKPGKITVMAKSLHDIIRELDNVDVTLKLGENDRLEVRAGNTQFNIPGLAAKEFPNLPQVETQSAEIDCESFYALIEKTSYSMTVDETRHNLAGIYLEKNDSGLRAVATDGHRLALKDLKQTEIQLAKGIIIPRKGVLELKKMIAKEGSFELAIGDKNVFARKGNETLYVRLIDGDFPDYTRVIPQDNDKEALIPREKMIGALRRVSLMANEKSRGVVMNLSSGMVEVSINNPDLGEAREQFDTMYKGGKVSIGLNARYFIDALEVMKDDSFSLTVKNELAPCLIKSTQDQGYLAVIMPMRI